MSGSRGERLAALRSALAGTDAFYLQRTDNHGSEYLPPDAERVSWVSGFTGSAAVAVILHDRAAVFSDGRYTLQLSDELDPDLFEACHITLDPPSDWMKRHLGQGAVIGYDPMLTKDAERSRLEAVANELGGRLKPLAPNPVDQIWHDRPGPSRSAVMALDDRYAGEPSVAKRARIGELLQKAGSDCHLITSPDSIAWLLNIRGQDIDFNPLCLSYALLEPDGTCRWFVDSAKLPADLLLGNMVSVEPCDGFISALGDLSGRTVSVDLAYTHVGFIDAVIAGGGVIKKITDPVVAAKAQKNDVELDGARAAHRRDGAAMARFLAWLDRIPLDGSVSELDAVDRLLAERQKEELFQGPSFDTISGHGPNGAIVHYRVTPDTSRPLTGGTLYLSDSGGQYLDATTDITRTVALGAPSDEMRTRFTAVLKGHIALATARFPKGTNGGQLDTLARQPLWNIDLDYDHGTGHGIGSFLCVHEGPARIAKAGSRVELKPGMILSNEPGYYKSGSYGIRIENLIVVRPTRPVEGGERTCFAFETITRAPIDRRLIVRSMLSPDEVDWLDRYHQTVLDEIGPRLDQQDRPWLQAACAPLL